MRLLLPIIMLVLGLLLLGYMVTVESEPGLLPLLLIAVSTAWLLAARLRAQARRGRHG